MNNLLTSFLCCSLTSKQEQKSVSTSATSSGITETQKRLESENNDAELHDNSHNHNINQRSQNSSTAQDNGDMTTDNSNGINSSSKTNYEPKTPTGSAPSTPQMPKHIASNGDSPNIDEKLQNGESAHVGSEQNDKEDEDEEEDSDPNIPMDQISAQSEYKFDQFDLTLLQPDQSCASTGWLLEEPKKAYKDRKCLVLDLDETLVHSSFKYLKSADFVIPVEIEGQIHNVYVIKRPGVDQFMKRVGELYEVVVFTASVSRYGDPLLNQLDVHNAIHHRLFRDSCYNYQGNYIKNLSQIGRPLSDLIIIDNSPASYIFHPQHAVPISSWFSDAHDNELLDLLPFLEDLSKPDVDDVSLVLDITI